MNPTSDVMPETCPACHGRFDENACCERCGADAAYLRRLYAEMERLHIAAVQALADCRYDEAETLLAQARTYAVTPINDALTAWLPVLEAEQTVETEAEKPSRLESVKQFFRGIGKKSGF